MSSVGYIRKPGTAHGAGRGEESHAPCAVSARNDSTRYADRRRSLTRDGPPREAPEAPTYDQYATNTTSTSSVPYGLNGADNSNNPRDPRNPYGINEHGNPHALSARRDPHALSARQNPGALRDAGKTPIDAAEVERRGLLMQEMQMRKVRNKVRRKYVLMIIIAFLFAVALIYRYSLVIEINDTIVRERQTLSKLENDNSALLKQINVEIDLEKVRLLAESKLGMQKPDKDQIVYIKVPKRDHALVAVSAAGHEAEPINPVSYLIEQLRLIQKRLIAD